MDYTPSRFIRSTLMPNEHCIKDARFSWVYTLHAWGVLFFWLLCGYALHLALWHYMGEYTLMPIGAGAVVGLSLFLAMMVKRWTTEIILTNERLIYKYGLLNVSVQEVDIEQLASDRVIQSLLGRLFDYGAIYIRCIEADDIWLPPIRRPYEFRNALEQQKHAYREHYMKIERLRRHGDKESAEG